MHPRIKAIVWSLIGYYGAALLPMLHHPMPARLHWPVTAPLALTVAAALLGT